MLHLVFKYISSLGKSSVRKLPADILEELTMTALQLCVCVSNNRWPSSSTIHWKDATPRDSSKRQP